MTSLLATLSASSNRAKRMVKVTLRRHSVSAGSCLILLTLWWIISHSGAIDPIFLPTPEAFAKALITLFAERGFLHDIWKTMTRVAISFALSFATAVPLALILSESKFTRRLLSPYIDFLRYIPLPAMIPLMILFVGIGETAKISLLFFGTVFQLILLYIDNFDSIPQPYFDLAFSLHFSKPQTLLLKIRATLPEIYNQARISLGLLWSWIIIAEIIAADGGIGYVIKEAQRFSHTAVIFAGITTIGIIGLTIDSICKTLFYRLFPYKKTSL